MCCACHILVAYLQRMSGCSGYFAKKSTKTAQVICKGLSLPVSLRTLKNFSRMFQSFSFCVSFQPGNHQTSLRQLDTARSCQHCEIPPLLGWQGPFGPAQGKSPQHKQLSIYAVNSAKFQCTAVSPRWSKMSFLIFESASTFGHACHRTFPKIGIIIVWYGMQAQEIQNHIVCIAQRYKCTFQPNSFEILLHFCTLKPGHIRLLSPDSSRLKTLHRIPTHHKTP